MIRVNSFWGLSHSQQDRLAHLNAQHGGEKPSIAEQLKKQESVFLPLPASIPGEHRVQSQKSGKKIIFR